MPLYDYRCPECDVTFEVTRSADSASAVCCPTCEGPAKRVFTPVGVVFKGSGFHNTDYRPGKSSEDGPAKCPSADKSSSACAGCPSAGGD